MVGHLADILGVGGRGSNAAHVDPSHELTFQLMHCLIRSNTNKSSSSWTRTKVREGERAAIWILKSDIGQTGRSGGKIFDGDGEYNCSDSKKKD